jgi:hypothetical protein
MDACPASSDEDIDDDIVGLHDRDIIAMFELPLVSFGFIVPLQGCIITA